MLDQKLIILQHLVSFNPLTSESPFYRDSASAWILVHRMKLSCATLPLLALVSGVVLRNPEPGLYYCGRTLLNIKCGERSGKRGMAVVYSPILFAVQHVYAHQSNRSLRVP